MFIFTYHFNEQIVRLYNSNKSCVLQYFTNTRIYIQGWFSISMPLN